MVNNDDIVNFIAQTIEIGGLFTVTKDENKFIMIDGEQVKHKLVDDVEARPLAIYGTMATNAYIVNPFNEGEASQSITNWYYSTRNITIARILGKLVMRVLAAGLRSHGKNATEEEGDALCAKYLGKYAGKVDEKMIKEFESLKGSINEMANIFYNKTKRKCVFNCLIFKQSSRTHYTNIRKGSWEVFDYITTKLLGIVRPDKDDFDWTPDNPNIPVFESFINIYVMLLERLEEPAKLIDIDLSNWKVIKQYLPYLDQYYQQAKWCTDSINHMKTMCENSSNTCATCGSCTGTGTSAPDLPPAVVSTINRMNGAYAPRVMMQPTNTVNSDLPPTVRQKMVGMGGVPVQYNSGSVNSDLPPMVRQKLGY